MSFEFQFVQRPMRRHGGHFIISSVILVSTARKSFVLDYFPMRENLPSKLEKVCSVCGASVGVEIETVTNVMPQPEDMFPVLLCRLHKKSLQDKTLDITLDEKKNLRFTLKKKAV